MDLIGIAAAFLTAIPAGAGIGGGGLFIIYLSAVGYPQTSAGAANLIFYLSSASASLPYHLRRRRLNFKAVFIAAVSGILGTLLGGHLRSLISEEYLRQIFGVLLIFTGFRSLFRKKYTKFAASPSTRT